MSLLSYIALVNQFLGKWVPVSISTSYLSLFTPLFFSFSYSLSHEVLGMQIYLTYSVFLIPMLCCNGQILYTTTYTRRRIKITIQEPFHFINRVLTIQDCNRENIPTMVLATQCMHVQIMSTTFKLLTLNVLDQVHY